MGKRKSKRRQASRVKQRPKSRKKLSILIFVIVSLLCVATIGAPWRNLAGSERLPSFLSSPPTVPTPSHPTKEYIYAGGKLIATEEPVNLLAPTNLNALTLSNLPAPQISVSWGATTGADHYEIERTTNINGAYTTLSSNWTSTTYTDTNVTAVTAYLYRVRAVDSFGNGSPYSNLDVATAINFTDDTLISQSTLVKAAHVNELRQAVDAVRSAANLAPANWGGNVTQFSTTIQATHVDDLRTNLNAALAALGLPSCTYTDNSLTALQASFIKKEHIDQLRQCVK